MKSRCLQLFLLLSIFYATAQSPTEQKLGELTFKMVKETQGIYVNESALQYVKSVGLELEKHLNLGYPLKYYLVDTAEPNAFATAGGYVYVTRGLLSVLNSRDELAGIMGHELSHVSQHHSTKKMAASVLPLLLELPANIVGLLTYKEVASIINFPIDEAAKISIAAFDRSQERTADKLGVELATRAGYNPYGLVIGLERLEEYISTMSDEKRKKTLFIDHPMTSDRVKYLTGILEKQGHKRTGFSAGTEITSLDGLVYGQNPNGGIIIDNVFVHPSIELYCAFPAKWTIRNSPESITAMSEDKKSTIMVMVDTSAMTPDEAAQKFLVQVKESTILNARSGSINGNDAFLAAIRNKSVKYADHLTEIMWLKMQPS